MPNHILPRVSLRSSRHAILRFGRDHGGTAAVEFGLIVPLLVTIVFCFSELSRACDNYKKVSQIARVVADLTAQGDAADPMPTAKMNDILSASKLVLRPFDSTGAKIVVSAVGVYNSSGTLKPRICSSTATSNTAARATGFASDLTVPDGFQSAGMRYVIAEVTMPYVPMLGTMVANMLGGTAGQYTFKVNTPWPSRGGTQRDGTVSEVTLPAGAPCPKT